VIESVAVELDSGAMVIVDGRSDLYSPMVFGPILKHKVIVIEGHSFQHLFPGPLRFEFLAIPPLFDGILSFKDNAFVLHAVPIRPAVL